MNWDMSISKLENLVTVKTSGLFNFEQIKKMTIETFNAATANGIGNILGDHRDLDPQISIFDMYNLPRDLLKEGVKQPTKVAVVYLKASTKAEEIEFFETTACNVAIQAKSFTNIEEARLWLRK